MKKKITKTLKVDVDFVLDMMSGTKKRKMEEDNIFWKRPLGTFNQKHFCAPEVSI